MFAIVSINGQQYKLTADKEYNIPLVKTQEKKIKFEDVLAYSENDKITLGTPKIAGASVEAEIIGDVLDKKIEVSKFHSKKRYDKNNGHRQAFTKVKILSINLKNEK